MHNRQMLTALMQNQYSYMQSMSSELDMADKSGQNWASKMANKLSSGHHALLLTDADRFRQNIQWRAKGHKGGTEEFMKYFFKTGLEFEDLTPDRLKYDTARRFLQAENFGEIFGLTGTHFGDETAIWAMEDGKQVGILANVLGSKYGKGTIGSALVERGYLSAEDLVAQSDAATGQLKFGGAFGRNARSGVAAGFVRMAVGDPMSQQGAGKMSTIEPRFFNLIEGPGFGKHGAHTVQDILKRIQAFDVSPAGEGKIAIHQETGAMLQSLVGKKKPGKGAEVYAPDMRTTNVQEVMEGIETRGNRIISQGSTQELFLKMGDDTLYIPPVDMHGMQRQTLPDGFPAAAQIRGHIRDYVTSSLEKGTVNASDELVEAIGAEWASEGKGMGAWTRNKPAGGYQLTAGKIPTVADKAGLFQGGAQDLSVSLITETYAKQMVKDLQRSGLYDADELAAMSKRLLGGEDVAGLIWRHPGIGDQSIQKTKYRVIGERKLVKDKQTGKEVMRFVADKSNKGPAIYIADADVLLQDMPRIQQDLADNLNQGIRQQTRLQLGTMVGTAGDYDFDTFHTMLVDPKLEKKYMEELADPAYMRQQVQHQIRFQLLSQAKGYPEATDSMKQVIAAGGVTSEQVKEAQRLAIANENIGKISSQMTSARRSALSYMPRDALGRVGGLLQWIEQKPIGFKHADPEVLRRQLGDLSAAFTSGKADELDKAIRGFLGSDYDILGKDFELSKRDAKAISQAVGQKIGTKQAGWALNETIEELSLAILKGNADQLQLESNVHRGRSSAAAIRREISSMAVAASGGKPGRLIANVEQMASNLLGQAGKGVLTHHTGIKALAAVGGLAALTSFNSQPREMVGPGKQFNANVKMKMNQRKAAKTITNKDVRPTKAPIGNPMGPNLLAQRRAMIASHPVPTNKFIVRARANHPGDIGIISQQLQSFATGGSSMNITNTQRSINNPYGAANQAY
tara:strand:- start:25 stop:2928 length:2904 start_codon:yes stop_codon:yes gene_type:complete